MSQPLDQYATINPLGEQREDLGEFFLANPWQQDNHNLSSYERNRLLLNTGDAHFANVSFLTTADLDSDSRSAIATDLNNDGMVDLIVRSVGGGPLRVFRNQWPKSSWLKVSLEGTRSNSLGLGAVVTIQVGGRTVSRTMFPVTAYQSQSPSLLHFGLGDERDVDSVQVRWPSGAVVDYGNLSGNQHVMLNESGDWRSFSDAPMPSE